MSIKDYQIVKRISASNAEEVYIAKWPSYPNKKFIYKKFTDYDSYSNEKFLKEIYVGKRNQLFCAPKLIDFDFESKITITEYIEHSETTKKDLFSKIHHIIKLLKKIHDTDIKTLDNEIFIESSTMEVKNRIDRIQKKGLHKIMQNEDEANYLISKISVSDRKDNKKSLCHGDFHLRNILFTANVSNTYVIDWSLARLAFPSFDIGFFIYKASMGQYIEKLGFKEIKELLMTFVREYPACPVEIILSYFYYCMIIDYFWIINNSNKFSSEEFTSVKTNIESFLRNSKDTYLYLSS